jgi:hypothetical protein
MYFYLPNITDHWLVIIVRCKLINSFFLRFPLFFFLKCLLTSRLILHKLSAFILVVFYNHLNLTCFLWSNNFEHSSSNHGLYFFNSWYSILSLAEILVFSLKYSPQNLSFPELRTYLRFEHDTTLYLLRRLISWVCTSPYELCALFAYSLPVPT